MGDIQLRRTCLEHSETTFSIVIDGNRNQMTVSYASRHMLFEILSAFIEALFGQISSSENCFSE